MGVWRRGTNRNKFFLNNTGTSGMIEEVLNNITADLKAKTQAKTDIIENAEIV